jgi:hypothetical protein
VSKWPLVFSVAGGATWTESLPSPPADYSKLTGLVYTPSLDKEDA